MRQISEAKPFPVRMVDLLLYQIIFRFLVGFVFTRLFNTSYIKYTPSASTDRGVFVSASWGKI